MECPGCSKQAVYLVANGEHSEYKENGNYLVCGLFL